jgi:hypothetical protein
MKKEKATNAELAENVRQVVKIIKALEANVENLKTDIANGHVNKVSIFCAIGNQEADRVNTIIVGSSNDLILTLANALDEELHVQKAMTEALILVV